MTRFEMRRSITAKEAEAYLGIPAVTIRVWASRKRLLPCGIRSSGEREYRLVDVLDLGAIRNSRKQHALPAVARGAAHNVT